jgi:hypothetical protein
MASKPTISNDVHLKNIGLNIEVQTYLEAQEPFATIEFGHWQYGTVNLYLTMAQLVELSTVINNALDGVIVPA